MTIKMAPGRAGAARRGNDARAEAFIAGETRAPAKGKTVVNSRWDAELLRRIDQAARKQGISRTAWLHVAAAEKLGR